MIAGLLDDGDDGKNLLDAARDLAGAFTNLLKAAQEGGGIDTEVRCLIRLTASMGKMKQLL